ncbi:MAG: glycosyltransferase family 2 protein [Paludibacteraceae bacterium]
MIIADKTYIQNPLVSVFIIAYNQEKTVAQTIESVLMQRGNFSMELIVGEDAGTDGTRQICIDYQKKYPEKIKLLLQDTNQGLVKNFIDCLNLCRGEYIALCAGDDYWIDERKLEKQIEFLKNHPAYGVVSTGGYRLIVRKNKLKQGIAPLNPPADGEVFDLTWRGGVYAMPLSLMFRSNLLQYIDFDEFIKRKFSCEDVPMQAIMAKHTKFGHIADLTCVYRVYDTSMTFTSTNSPKFLYYHQGLVEIRRYLYELYPDEVEFSEVWAQDYMTYRRFLLAVYNVDYKSAKKELSQLNNITEKESRAIKYCSNRLSFYLFCLGKKLKLYKARWKNSSE